MIKKRLARARALILHHNLDGLLVSMPANRRYLSGFSPDDGQWGESSGTLLLGQTAAFLLTDFRYELTARRPSPALHHLHTQRRLGRRGAALAGRGWDQTVGL